MKRSVFSFASTVFLSFFVVLLGAGVPQASMIVDTVGNSTFATARSIDPFFSTGTNPDIGNSTPYNGFVYATPNPLTTPWVSIVNNRTGGEKDYFSFTVSNPSSGVWIDVDYGYTTLFPGSPSQTDYNTRIDVFNSSGVPLTNTSSMFQDGDYRLGGTGSLIYAGTDTLDAFWYLQLNPGAYVIGIAGADSMPLEGKYTLQVSVENHPVPIPSAIFLFAPGLLGLVAIRRKFKK